jgi:pimeloyl-ACP methyl ester carboxylesterase
MVQTPANPGGLPIEVFDGLRQQLAANRAQFYRNLASGPFYGYNRPGAQVSQAVIENWWRQGMMGGAKAHYDGIRAFSETDFTEDLKIIDVPTLVMHGDDDQIVPIADSALLSAKLLRKGTLKVYEKFPHGMSRRTPARYCLTGLLESSAGCRADAPSNRRGCRWDAASTSTARSSSGRRSPRRPPVHWNPNPFAVARCSDETA